MDLVKLPPGADWAVGTIHGAGTVVLDNSLKMLQIPLWRSFLAGNILLVLLHVQQWSWSGVSWQKVMRGIHWLW